jgi:serine/threonine-protein kinase
MVLELEDCVTRYVAVGDVVAGKYLVERVLGTGSMAFVLSARDLDLEEPFALKFLNSDLLRDAGVVERFIHEARAACAIASKHVVRVYDVGTHEGVPFVVMEHVRGRDLSAVLRADGPLRVDDAVDYTLQACEALAAAHAHGIVHRDVKPENLFIVEQKGTPSVKLLGCGITKRSLGTPSYRSPEQIRCAASADPQCDLWSLGAVLYELLTGRPAFSGVTVTEVCAAVLESCPRPIWELRPDVPRELADVVMRSFEKDRERRFATMAELATALLPFARRGARMIAESWLRTQSAETPCSDGPISSTPTSWARTRSEEILPPPSDAAPRQATRRRRRVAEAAAVALIVSTLAAVVGSYRAMAPQADAPRVAAAAIAQPASSAPATAPAAPAAAPAASDDPKRPLVRKAVPAKPRAKPVAHTPSAIASTRRVDLGY